MADIGYIVLILALVASIFSSIALVLGTARGYAKITVFAGKGSLAICGMISLAAYLLYYALLSHNFELEYVYSHTSRDMPLVYNISAFWAGNAGALLFLAWLLSLAVILIVIRKREEDIKFTAYATAVITATLTFLLLLIVFYANPFEKHGHAPADGLGLNPMLENPGMIIHPPLLLSGYIAFTIPFALVISALITKKQDNSWLSAARTWGLLAWLLLGAGNIVGAWWAYVELGWGGYWAWDPVENAGLMPWLMGTAFLHSANVQSKTGALKTWSTVLIILTFNLCIFGMFLNRSDFLSSVHNYTDTGMEVMFLSFLAVTLLGPLFLIFIRLKYLRVESKDSPLVSKKNSFVLSNMLFIAATLAVLLGTLLPWISETIFGTITTVKASFFNKSAVPIFLLIILLAGICILVTWRRISLGKLFRKGIFSLILAFILGLILFVIGIREWYALTLFPLCSFTISLHLLDLYGSLRAGSRRIKENRLKLLFNVLRTNRSYYGGMVVHIGIILIAIGIIGSSFYQSKVEAGLTPGESISIQDYSLTYEELLMKDTSDNVVYKARLSVYKEDSYIATVEPEISIQHGTGQLASEVAIHAMPYWWFPVEDLYVVFAGQTTEGIATFQFLVNPLVNLIWIGGGVMILGGIFAFWPGKTLKNRFIRKEQ